MANKVTTREQAPLPKGVRQAAGGHPGDRVEAPAKAEGGVSVEHAERDVAAAYLRALEDVSRRKPIKDMTTEAIMAMTRGED